MKYIIVVILMFAQTKLSSQDMPGMGSITYRPPTVAGSFYPEDGDTLRKWINKYLEKTGEVKQGEKVFGIVVPHAGYVFSGWIAAAAYKHIVNQKYDAIIIISPSHTVSFPGASVFDGYGYVTPIGTSEVDRELANEIASFCSEVKLSRKGHEWNTSRTEHAIEVQLPFLQVVQPNVPIVPICMGSQDYETVNALSNSIVTAVRKLNRKVLLIASSDLSHYHDTKTCKILDSQIINTFNNYDYFKLELNLFSQEYEACGGAPILVVMRVCEQLGANHSRTILSANSAESPYIKSDSNRVVGYFSGIISKSEEEIPLLPDLSEKEIIMILGTAKSAVKSAVTKEIYKPILNLTENLKREFATFVTLKKHGELRGCLGNTVSQHSLLSSVEITGKMSATRDSRFKPVTRDELDDLEIEVTILSRMKKVIDINEIVPGRDGVYIRLGNHSGVFLPQVATEQGWDRITLLEQIGRKAGLNASAYLNPKAEIFIFRGIIIK